MNKAADDTEQRDIGAFFEVKMILERGLADRLAPKRVWGEVRGDIFVSRGIPLRVIHAVEDAEEVGAAIVQEHGEPMPPTGSTIPSRASARRSSAHRRTRRPL